MLPQFNLGHVFGVNAANLIDGARSGPEYSQERLKLHEKILKSDFNTSRTLASTNNGYIKRQENQIAKVLTGEKATCLSLLVHLCCCAVDVTHIWDSS